MQSVAFKKAVPVWEKGKETEKNYSLIFRETVENTAKTLKIAGSSVYNVYINGVHTMHGPARSAHGFYRVDEVPLHLTEPENKIEIFITAANVHSFYSIFVPGFLCCEILDASGNVLKATGSDFPAVVNPFRVQKCTRYSYQRTFNEVYNLCENPAEIPAELVQTEDKRFIAREVYYPDYTPIYPENILLTGNAVWSKELLHPCRDRCYIKVGQAIDGYTIPELEADIADAVGHIDFQIKDRSARNAKCLQLKVDTYGVYAFPQNSTGLISLEAECEEDATLYLCFDELLEADGYVNYNRLSCINACRWSMKKGTYKITTAEPYTFKYLSAAATGKIKIRFLHIKSLCFPRIEQKYHFKNTALEQIYKAAIETFRQNALDVYTDCPSRERAGWLCDSFFTGRTEYALTGKTTVEKAFLENFLLPDSFENLPKGMLPMCYPADFIDGQFIPNWAMFYVLQLQEYRERSGNTGLTEFAKSKMYALLNYFKGFENEQGLLVDLENWIFVEWSACNDYVRNLNFPTNMLYARMKQALGELYGDEALLKESRKLHQAIRDTAYFDGFFHDRAVWDNGTLKVTGELTETCQYYAFFCGTATPDLYPDLWKTMVEDFGPERKNGENKWKNVAFSNAFIGNYLRLELLYIFGEHSRLLKNIEDYFGFMAEKTGTLWEHDVPAHSLNHGFASHVILWLGAYAEGKLNL